MYYISAPSSMENPYPPLVEAHIIPLAYLREMLRNTYFDVMPGRYKTPLIGNIKPWCYCTNVGCKGEWGLLGGVTKDGNENGVTIITDSGEYTLYASGYNVMNDCITVKLRSSQVIPPTTVRGVYMAFTSSTENKIRVVNYTFRIRNATNTLTIIHCRI